MSSSPVFWTSPARILIVDKLPLLRINNLTLHVSRLFLTFCASKFWQFVAVWIQNLFQVSYILIYFDSLKSPQTQFDFVSGQFSTEIVIFDWWVCFYQYDYIFVSFTIWFCILAIQTWISTFLTSNTQLFNSLITIFANKKLEKREFSIWAIY